jgi:hypothetical protein
VEVEMLDKAQGLEEQLRQWQAERVREGEGRVTPPLVARRTVRINGREVEIVRKPRRST